MYVLDEKWFVILMLIFVMPFGVYLLWRNEMLETPTRVVVSITMGLLFLLFSLGWAFVLSQVTDIRPQTSESVDTQKQIEAIVEKDTVDYVTPEQQAVIDKQKEDNRVDSTNSVNSSVTTSGSKVDVDKSPKVVADIVVPDNITTGASTKTTNTVDTSTTGGSSTTTNSTTTAQTVDTLKDKNRTVYITSVGGTYHEAGCSLLSKGSSTLSYESAVTLGLAACPKCHQ